MRDKIVALLTDKRFWKTSAGWTAGIAAGFTFILGLGAWREAFVNAPLQTVVVFIGPAVLGITFGAIQQLERRPMDDEEIAERVDHVAGSETDRWTAELPWSER